MCTNPVEPVAAVQRGLCGAIDMISGAIDGWTRLMGESSVQRIDILEPHKAGQGSITMLKKVSPPSRLHSSDILQPRT